MPRCCRMKEKSAPGTRLWIPSTSALRMALMRSRMAPSSFSHCARRSGLVSTVATMAPPWVGGLE